MTPQAKKIQIARTTLLLDQPFFGTLALQLRIVEDPTCPTAWTDGNRMGYNPAFVDSLTAEELCGVIAHEIMHCACGHPWRRDSRLPLQWNVAADYAINPILVDAGMKLPSNVLLDAQFKGKSAEWIYDRIPPVKVHVVSIGDVRDAGTGEGDGNGKSKDGDSQSKSESGVMTEADWQQAVQQSLQQAKMQGKLPSNLARELGALVKPRVDWRSLLRRYIQEITKADYSWTRPNPRYIASGFYLPALYSHACGRIAVAIDTSGSIDDVLLNQFCAELQAIHQELEPSAVDVLYCDAKVHRVDTFARGELVTLHAVGGGGTSFAPVFEHYATDGDQPVVLVYLTDLQGSFPSQAPEYPVIWCTVCEGTAPFGDIVECNV